MVETFVFGESEVKKTGRTASKQGLGANKILLVEITPSDPNEGTWKKFVSPTALFTIDPVQPPSAGPSPASFKSD